MRYVLVEWPESQEFMGRSNCYFCQCNDENSFGALDQAMFVPENVYDSYINDIECKLDYWTRLEHQYAGMAMQGILSRQYVDFDKIIEKSVEFAHALVEKMKNKEE